jgi:hypothetical protein
VLEHIIEPMADAFMQVGVFVALLAAPFGWARYRWGDRFDAALERHRRLGPLVAALLTVPPGCGGAIIVMAVYSRGAVSYGAAVSALVATMGDASWVLLAAEPVLTLQLKVLLVVTGTLTGYLVDALGVAPKLRRERVAVPAGAGGGGSARAGAPAVLHREISTPAAMPAMPAMAGGGSPPAVASFGLLPLALWLFLACGFVVSFPATFQLMDPAAVGESLLGGVDPYLALGAIGTALCLVAFVCDGCKVADDDEASANPGSTAEVLRQGGREVAFVTVWVAAAYVSWGLFSTFTGFDGSQLPLFGAVGVLVGACVGLIPGCAIQIVFTGIFLAGGMPLSTLAANTVSQDGDALIPLLALEHRSALLATVITTIPAIVVGGGILLLG